MEIEEVLTEIEPIDLTPLLDRNPSPKLLKQTAAAITRCLHLYGVVVVKDPRVSFEKNAQFLDMMETYFNRPNKDKLSEVRPDLAFQVGATPSNQEVPRNHCARIDTLDADHHPLTPCPPEADPKWRYFWRLGSQGEEISTQDKASVAILNSSNITPKGIQGWNGQCNEWGGYLLGAGRSIAEGLALGLNLPRKYFTDRMDNAPHLLAPTATDMNEFGKKGTIVAGYHYDLNFLTVHGKSRYPGLYVWLRDGRKVKVSVPDGCLLAQAAKQMEFLTGGYVFAGFHEVVVSDDTLRAIRRQSAMNRPLWRISSTVFTHIRSDVPLVAVAPPHVRVKYPPMTAGEQVLHELEAINLSASLKSKL